jgi:hypothetical protein
MWALALERQGRHTDARTHARVAASLDLTPAERAQAGKLLR